MDSLTDVSDVDLPDTVSVHMGWSGNEACLVICGMGIDDFVSVGKRDDDVCFSANAWLSKSQALKLADDLIVAAGSLS